MNPSKSNAVRSRLETLEAREVPFAGGIPWPIPDVTFTEVGAISYADGVVTVIGTESADVVRVESAAPVLEPVGFTVPGGGFPPWLDRVRVVVTDAAGQPRTDADGNPLEMVLRASDVRQVYALTFGGDDQIVNTTATAVEAHAGDGQDTLLGGSGPDSLDGGAGHDSLVGGRGNDTLGGGSENDVLRGEGGRDLIQGGGGNDFVDAGAEDDEAYGGLGRDTVFGGDGDDTLSGGDGSSAGDGPDAVLGEAGNDRLRGEDGNDTLSGGSGNDALYGGAGNDDLRGDAHNDGLFGGSGVDVLRGGTGIDRFLRWVKDGNVTTIKDRGAAESLTSFKGTTVQSEAKRDGPPMRYLPGQWTLAEIEAVDGGMGWLHAEVGNTRMLRLKGGKELTLLRYGAYIPYDTADGINDEAETKANAEGSGISAVNYGNGTIAFTRVDPSDPESVTKATIHELAHNWEVGNPRWIDWLALSGWVKSSDPLPGQVLSLDRKWVYNATAPFVRDYGRTNPNEDFATAFEAYFGFKTGLPVADLDKLIPKLGFVGLFITSLA